MNFSAITDDLFIGNTPSLRDYDRLRKLGVHLIISMRFTRGPQPDSHHRPISALWLRSVDSPFFPISIQNLFCGAKAALETIHEGGKVYTHCAYGRHRSVAMGACILVAQGDMILLPRWKSSPDAGQLQTRTPITSARAF